MIKSQIFRYAAAGVLTIAAGVFLSFDFSTQLAQEEKRSAENKNQPSAPEKASTGRLPEKFAAADAVTRQIKDRSRQTVRVEIASFSDRARVTEYGTIIEDYGAFVLLSKAAKVKIPAALAHQTLERSINLPNGKFEPLTDAPASTFTATTAEKASARKGYYIVQFGGIVKDEWLDSLRETGAEVIQYVPHQAFLVYADEAAMNQISGHSRVAWAGKYTGEQKLAPEVREFAARAAGDTMFDVAVFKRADLAAVRAQIENSFGTRILAETVTPSNFFNVLRVAMPSGNLAGAAEIEDVFRIDPYIKPTAEDERAAQIVAGNYTSPTAIAPPGYNPLAQFGVDGTGVTVSVSDDGISIPGNGGFYVTAANTVDGPLRGATAGASGGHGHINASIIAGSVPFGVLDPTGYNYGIGIAPKANIINIPFLKSGNTTTDLQAIDDTLTTLGPNGVRGTISNNSWGNGTNGNSYDSYAAQYDGFVQDGSVAASIDPFCIVFSAGNSGATGLTRPKVAKNVIAVANSENIRTEIGGTGADNMDDLRSTSSRGPASDGRVKPDITAPGTVIAGSRAGTGGSVSGQIDANHSYSSGTSHAAPQVAGAAALFSQYWKNTHAGQSPSPSLIKASILLTGQEMNGSLTNGSTVPNGNEGWGRMNMKYMFNTGVPMKYVNEDVTFESPGASYQLSGTVSDASKPVRVTLVWTDPPGVGNPALVNNLDLTVNIGGTVYRGNVFANGNSTTGGTADTLNNVENIYLPSGIAAGTSFTITVSAVAINGNGVLGNADATDQHFSLVAYNFSDAPTAFRPKVSDFDGDGKSDVAVWRESNGTWYWINSSNNTFSAVAFGQAGDKLVPSDYDGDGKTDQAVYRGGNWYIQRSTDGFTAVSFGVGSDLAVPSDYDGDGKADVAVYRSGSWYIQPSSGGAFIAASFGAAGDRPAPGDYDGDGRSDLAVFRPAAGAWYLQQTTSGFAAVSFGLGTDKIAPADYDGDGKTDIAVFRDGNWYQLRSTSGFAAVSFGVAGDVPAAGDFDGDDKTDVNVYRGGNWYRLNSTTNAFAAVAFGTPSDNPIPANYVPIQ